MSRLLVCVALLVGAVLIGGAFDAPVLAQKEKGSSTIEISEGKDGKFRFTVRDADGKFMANSGANNFDSVKDAMAGVEAFKAAVSKAKVVVLKKKKDK